MSTLKWLMEEKSMEKVFSRTITPVRNMLSWVWDSPRDHSGSQMGDAPDMCPNAETAPGPVQSLQE